MEGWPLVPYPIALIDFVGQDKLSLEELLDRREANNAALQPFNDAADEYVLQVCFETSLTPDRCSEAFGDAGQ